MTRRTAVAHRFVDHIPEQLDDGVVYVSIPYATALHLCCCGCGNEVVTPFSPARWSLTFDGEAISLAPSIGNWSFSCQSHYWIDQGRVRWAARWTKERIAAGRVADQRSLDRKVADATLTVDLNWEVNHGESSVRRGIWARIRRWLR